MSKVEEKLNKVHINLWRPHYLALLAGKSYNAILLDAKTQRIRVIYLYLKNKFVHACEISLSKVENECNRLMKAFCIEEKKSLNLQSSRIGMIKRVLQSNIQHSIYIKITGQRKEVKK